MSYVQVPPDSAGKKVDTKQLTDGLDTVERQLTVIAGGSGTAEVVVVTDATPAAGDMGLVVRQAGTLTAVVTVTNTINVAPHAISGTALVEVVNALNISSMPAISIGSVAISGTALVAGNVNISTMPAVALVAGTVINNISATVTVAGSVLISGTATVAGSVGATVLNNLNISNTPSVVLAAGTANFGTLNDISRTVQVAIQTPFTLQGISTTVNVAIATPYVIQGISTTVTVAGNVNISTMPAITISNTPTVLAVARPMTPIAVNSASRGPKTVIASTSANVTLIAAPGNGLAIFVTMIAASNASGTFTRGRFGTSGTVGAVTQVMVQSGGGFVMQLDPPWEISANEAFVCSVKPNASEGVFTAHFFVASADAL